MSLPPLCILVNLLNYSLAGPGLPSHEIIFTSYLRQQDLETVVYEKTISLKSDLVNRKCKIPEEVVSLPRISKSPIVSFVPNPNIDVMVWLLVLSSA